MAEKTAAVSFRVDPDLKEKLASLAKADGRPLAQYLTRVLTAHVESAAKRKKQP